LWVVTRGLISPERRDSHDPGGPLFVICEEWESPDVRRSTLPLRLTASQFLDLRLFRSPRIITGLQRLVGFALLARGAFYFLAFFPT
jgi:hypothetical protein